MFIKRAKSRPSLRARDTDDTTPVSTGSPLAKSSFTAVGDAGDTSMEVDEGGIGSILEKKKAQKKEKSKKLGGGPGRLSFGGDDTEGGEGFKPKKSLLSQSIRLPSTPGGVESIASSSNATAGPSYSNDYLAELKAATPTRVPRNVEIEDEDDDGNAQGLSRIAREKYSSTIREDTTAGIPDAASIVHAKARRQAALEIKKHGGTEEDYISLGNGKLIIHDGASGPHPESRLMREEDEGDDGDEDLADYTESKNRLYIGKEQNKVAARRARGEIDELIAEREADDEDDEEAREWEEAQARRAGGKWDDETPAKSIKKAYVPAPTRPLPTPAAAQSRILKALEEAKSLKSENLHTLEITKRELESLKEQEIDLRKEVERVEGKREWMEEFRGWVEMLGKFLEEKIPKLEGIEVDGCYHLKERSFLIEKRREMDDSDDLSLFLGVPPSKEEEMEVDDLGRSRIPDAGPSSGIRRARREERISRRNRRVSRLTIRYEEEGYSTDDILAEGDQEDYNIAQNNLERRVQHLLEDVRAEDFRDPEKGLAVRFGGWREKYNEDYVNAFGGLSMVQAWVFWTRGEMMGWEPLRDERSLESFNWFTALYKYSRPKLPRGHTNGNTENDMDIDDDEDDEPPLGTDGDLVAQMVSDAVVPILIKSFENGAYDPYSAKQTRRAVDLVEVVQELMGKDSRKFTGLLKAVLLVFHEHLLALSASITACISSGATPPPAFDPASRTALQRYLSRRIKLLRNILLWKRLAPQEIKELCTRCVSEVVRPILERSWDGGGKEMGLEVLQVVGNELSPDLAKFLREGPGPSRRY